MGKASKDKHSNAASTSVLANLQYAVTLHQQGHLHQAKTIYLDVLRLQPKNPDALHLLGTIATKEKDFFRARDLIAQAIEIKPQEPIYQYNYGIVLYELGQYEAAIACYDRAIATEPRYAPLHLNRGNAQQKLKQFDLAVISYNQAIELQPQYAEAYSARGGALKDLRQYHAAGLSCQRAIEIHPTLAHAHLNLGNVLFELKRYNAAIACYQQASELDPKDSKFYWFLGRAYSALRQPALALNYFDRAIAVNPDAAYELDYGYGERLYAKLQLCDWTNIEQEFAAVLDQLVQGLVAKITMPFELLSMPSTSAQQQTVAKIYAQDEFFSVAMDFVAPLKANTQKIKIGYFSSDLNNHPVGQLTVGMFEAHDRSQFEVYGFGLTPTDASAIGQRLMRAFDHWVDLTGTDIQQALEVARASQLDIAINLNGYTLNNRNELFAHRIAPIQVNYLGYPGTMGAPFMDYIVADQTVIPLEHKDFYTEKVVYLPHSFLISSYAPASLATVPTRHEHQLPERGFIFCCFNNSYKITPDMFDVWMRLLAQVEGSVLWLSKQSEEVVKNLRREAVKRGIAPERLVFVQRIDSHDMHLARLGLADLFLDTLYYNAHTTAADALWAGLPVLTCLGVSFQGRVAASLLSAVGLPEMVTPSLHAYEALALNLASHPAKLQAIKEKLAANRLIQPLFDTALTTKHVEAAYQQMQAWHLQGLDHKAFTNRAANIVKSVRACVPSA